MGSENFVLEVGRALSGASSLAELLQSAARFIAEHFEADTCIINLRSGPSELLQGLWQADQSKPVPREGVLRLEPNKILFGENAPPLPIFVSDVETSSLLLDLTSHLATLQMRAFAAVPLFLGDNIGGVIECHYHRSPYLWRRHRCYDFYLVSERISTELDRFLGTEAALASMGDKLQFVAITTSSGEVKHLKSRSGWGAKSEGSQENIFSLLRGVISEDALAHVQKVSSSLDASSGEVSFLLPLLTSAGERALFLVVKYYAVAPVRLQFSARTVDASKFSPSFTESVIARLERVTKLTNALVIRLDPTLRVLDAAGDSNVVLGVPAGELHSGSKVFPELFFLEDRLTWARKCQDWIRFPRPFTDECRIMHFSKRIPRTLHIEGRPLYHNQRIFSGWEIFVVDISELSKARLEITYANRKVQALYDISRLHETYHDSPLFASKSLVSLVKACDADGGFVCLKDFHMQRLNIAAAHGLSQHFLRVLSQQVNRASIVQIAFQRGIALVIGDLRSDVRTAHDIVRVGSSRSALLVPIVFEEQMLGVITLLSRRINCFNEDTLQLVQAAAAQMALTLRQLETFFPPSFQYPPVGVRSAR